MAVNKVGNQPLLIRVIKYGVYATAFIPLIIFKDFLSPFHFGKAIIFRTLIDVLAILYVVALMRYGRALLPPLTKLFWAVTFFTLAFAIATFTSVNSLQSFWGTLERMGGLVGFIHFWLFFVIITAVLRRKDEWLFFIKLSIWAGLLSAFYGFLQKSDWGWIMGSGGRNKIFGTLGNPALFAGYMIANALFALMTIFLSQSSGGKYLYGAIFLTDVLAIFLSGIRGSVLALIVGIVLFGFFYAVGFGSKRIKNLTFVFIILVFLTAGSLALLKNTNFVRGNRYLARYADISLTSYTVKTRAWAWQAGFDGLNDSFRYVLVGYGPDNFNIPFSKHFNPKFYDGPGSETLFDRAHNQFIEILVTMGLIGFAAYLSVFVLAFGQLRIANLPDAIDRSEVKIFRIGLISGLVAYIIHNSFIFDTTANFIVFFLTLGFINYLGNLKLNRGADSDKFNEALKAPKKNSALPIAAGLILSAAAALIVFYNYIRPAQANYATTRAITASWESNHELALKKFAEALDYDTFGTYEIRHRFAQYVIDRYNGKKITSQMETELLAVIKEVKKNAENFPRDYLPYLYISRAYILLGKGDPQSLYNDLALEASAEALKISPTFVRTYFEVAQAYLNKNDLEKAVEYFGTAANLNPNVGISWWYLGAVQGELGDLRGAGESLKKALTLGYDYNQSGDLPRLITLYNNLKDYKSLILVFKRLVEKGTSELSSLEPSDSNYREVAGRVAQYHASLAAALVKIGDIDGAVAEARMAAQIDKTFENEAKMFVRGLGREW